MFKLSKKTQQCFKAKHFIPKKIETENGNI